MTDSLPSAFVAHLWQSTLVAGIVWLATLALRGNRPRVRYWLWTAASLKFLVPLSWLVALGSRFEWRTAPAVARPVTTFVLEEVLASPLPAAVSMSPLSAGQPSPWLWVLASVWVAGFLVVLFWWWRQWRPVGSALRHARPVDLGAGYDVANLAVMSSPSTLEPGVVGVWRPVLLLPEGLVDRLTPAQLNALLAHERCHVRCHDNLAAAAHMLVEAIFWFHPLVWWIERRMIDERERACDEAVLRAGNDPDEYAEGILTVCRFTLRTPLACVTGVTGSDLRARLESIARSDLGMRLTFARRAAIALLGSAVVGVPIVSGLTPRFHILGAEEIRVATRGRFAQNAAPAGQRPAFEVVSIKRTDPNDTRPGADFTALPGGRLLARNNAVSNFITNAFGVPNYTVIGGPAWMREDRYDLDARAAGEASRAEVMLMLQTLLADRFQFRMHRETRELPAYVLTVARGGSKLTRSKDGGCVDRSPANRNSLPDSEKRPNCGNNLLTGRINPPNMTWSAVRIDTRGIAEALAGYFRRPVVDRTGLTGFFDIQIDLPPLSPATSPDGGPDSGPSVFTVLQEQLGLRVEEGRGPVEVLVVDRLERPIEN
ncbi:MAG: M56 family metallopeptidase [Vicinamibacterales bacterium]